MKKGEIFALGDEGWRCRESYRNGLILAQLVGGAEFAYIRRVGGRFERIAPKFTRENIVVGAFAQPVFSNARFDFVKIENGKVDFNVAFRTPVGRNIKCEIKNFDFETCLKKLNDVFVFSPTVEQLPADFRYIHPLNNDDWAFRIVEDCGKDIIFVEIWYKKRKIDGRYMSRENLAEYLNAPFEFVKPEIKGEEKMTHETSTDYESDLNAANSVLFYTTDELITGKTVVYSDGQKKVKIVAEPRDCLKRIVRFGDEEDSREINSRVLCAMINFRKEDVRESDVCENLCVYKRNNPSEIYVVTSYDRDARKVNVNVLSSTNGSYLRQIVSVPIADFLSEVNDKFPSHSDVIKRLIDCRKEIEDIVKNCKNPLDRLLDDDMPWRKQVEALNPNLPKGYSIKPQIVETGFAEDLKDGLHKD